MPLPGSVTAVTVNGGYVRADGTVPTGTVTFRPSVRSIVAGTTIAIEPVTVALDAAGQISVQLAWQDDLDLTPHGWTYQVIETIGGDSNMWSVKLPQTGPVALDTLAPVDEVVPTVVRVLSVNGELPDPLGNVEVGAGSAPVQSVDGRIGNVVLGDLYVDPTELASGLAGKANTSHTHAEADITGLTADLAAKSDVGHTHNQSDVSGLTAALTAKADLVGGKIPQSQIPAVALVDFLGAIASQAAMLALTGQRGDWATRTDLGTDWQLIADDPTQLASWREMTYPASPVSSVAGRTGTVVLTKTDVDLANVDDTSDANKPISTAAQTALDGKAAKPKIRQAWITSADINPLPNTAGAWAPLSGFEIQLPAVVGDYVELSVNAMRKDIGGNAWLDQAVVTGAGPTIARYLSSGGATPGVEGDPGWYVPSGGIVGRSASRGFTVTAPDLDGGNVRFVMAVKSNGTGILYASTNYPFFWKAENKGPVS